MSTVAESKLKHFGKVDAIFFGTKLSSNLISLALISLVPGFGEHGVIISASLMLLISGLLEVPTGYWGDRVGWEKTVYYGHVFKILTTIFMIGAVCSALFNEYNLIWMFVAAEAISDAFANSLISGSYQAGYLAWYRNGGEQRQVKSLLFVESFQYGISYRIGIPLAAISIGWLVSTFVYVSSFSKIFVLSPLVFVGCFRIVCWRIMRRDLLSISIANKEKMFESHLSFQEVLKVFVATWPGVIRYIFYKFSQNVIIFLAISEAYKIWKILGYSIASSWVGGISCGLVLQFANLVFGRLFYQKISTKLNEALVSKASLIALFFFYCVMCFSNIGFGSKYLVLDFNIFLLIGWTDHLPV